MTNNNIPMTTQRSNSSANSSANASWWVRKKAWVLSLTLLCGCVAAEAPAVVHVKDLPNESVAVEREHPVAGATESLSDDSLLVQTTTAGRGAH